MKFLSLLRHSALILGLMVSAAQASPIVYEGTLSNGVTVFGSAPLSSFSTATKWDFWRFTGNAGDVVTITMDRTSNQMDPGVALYAGIGGDTAGLGYLHSASDGLLTFQTMDDDSGSNTPVDGPFWNALIFNFALTSSGDFTIAAYDVFGELTGPWTYALTMTIVAAAEVPEPGSLALLGLGLVGLAAMRKRKQA